MLSLVLPSLEERSFEETTRLALNSSSVLRPCRDHDGLKRFWETPFTTTALNDLHHSRGDRKCLIVAGRQATLQFKQTVSYFKALYQQLQQRQCPPEMVAGLWMFIEDIQGRNYLHAYDIYMHLAVGASLTIGSCSRVRLHPTQRVIVLQIGQDAAG